jgi:hypothetical protein
LVDRIEEEINNKAPSENKNILLLAPYYLYMNEKLGDCIKVLDVSSINPSIHHYRSWLPIQAGSSIPLVAILPFVFQ